MMITIYIIHSGNLWISFVLCLLIHCYICFSDSKYGFKISGIVQYFHFSLFPLFHRFKMACNYHNRNTNISFITSFCCWYHLSERPGTIKLLKLLCLNCIKIYWFTWDLFRPLNVVPRFDSYVTVSKYAKMSALGRLLSHTWYLTLAVDDKTSPIIFKKPGQCSFKIQSHCPLSLTFVSGVHLVLWSSHQCYHTLCSCLCCWFECIQNNYC